MQRCFDLEKFRPRQLDLVQSSELAPPVGRLSYSEAQDTAVATASSYIKKAIDLAYVYVI